jgi:hypothetical protein
VSTFYRLRHPRRVAVAAVAVVLAGSGAAVGIVGASRSGSATPTTALSTSAATIVPADNTNRPRAIFTDTCKLVKVANDDPLLAPGMTGMSMDHDFFGNPDVNASSTAASLRGGNSTCTTSADASAYWTPVLYQHDRALSPQRTLLYWRTPSADAATTKTMPPGISMIAGNESAAAPQGSNVIDWTCQTKTATTRGVRRSTPVSCPAGHDIRLVITFPSCWDGHSLAGALQTNVIYPTGASCPAGHPVRIPTLVLHEVYPTSSAAALTLSMGPHTQGSTDTAHADFINGWNQRDFDAVATTCITGAKACGPVTGPAATPTYPHGRPSGDRGHTHLARHHHQRKSRSRRTTADR